MSERRTDQWEARLQQAAQAFPYPPTPDVAGAVARRLARPPAATARPVLRRRWIAWVAVGLGILLLGLLSVPQVRAGVLEILRLGAIRIVPFQPTPAVAPTSTAAPGVVTTETPPTATPLPTPTPLASVLDLAGETTLAEARAQAGFPVRLPGYPQELAQPDKTFVQQLGGGKGVVLVWLDPAQPDKVRMSLHELGPGTFGEKIQPRVIQETAVHHQRALWAEGPYLLELKNGGYDVRRMVPSGHVLIWTEGDITYRLETDLSLDQAIRVAESLR